VGDHLRMVIKALLSVRLMCVLAALILLGLALQMNNQLIDERLSSWLWNTKKSLEQYTKHSRANRIRSLCSPIPLDQKTGISILCDVITDCERKKRAYGARVLSERSA
jgi:hypothetical protein